MAHHPEVYAQCKLRRGNTFQTAWIPSVLAKTGKYLKIRGVDGWLVVGVGKYLNQSILFPMSNEYRYHRGVTDI